MELAILLSLAASLCTAASSTCQPALGARNAEPQHADYARYPAAEA